MTRSPDERGSWPAPSPDGHDRDVEATEDRVPAVDEEPAVEDESMVSNPAALIRVANMLQMLTVEVHELPLDDAGRRRLFDVQHRAVDAIKALVSDDLDAELTSLGLPVEDVDASESELRIAQAQIVGWLNGLFQGIQAAIYARQMVSVDQLQELQRQLARASQPAPPGQYL